MGVLEEHEIASEQFLWLDRRRASNNLSFC